uniref:Putative secreted protein n=1 Tax=Ixodes ricinus TaxID=34613 RepID=A0A147BMF1_IXORI
MLRLLHGVVRVEALLVHLVQPAQGGLAKAHKLHCRSIPGRGRVALVASLLRAAHLVHPSATVVGIPAAHKARTQVDAGLHVEAFVSHLRVNLVPCIALPERDALEVPLDRLLNHFFQRHILGAGLLGRAVVGRVEARHPVLEQEVALGHLLAVVLDALQPPPHRIPAVVACVRALVQQVRDQAVPQAAPKRQQQEPGFLVPPREQEEPAEGDEGVPAPVPHVPGRKVGQAGSQGGADLLPAVSLHPVRGQGRDQLLGQRGQVRAWHKAHQHHRAQGQLAHQGGAVLHKVGHLLPGLFEKDRVAGGHGGVEVARDQVAGRQPHRGKHLLEPLGELEGALLSCQPCHNVVHEPVARPQVVAHRVTQVVLGAHLRQHRHQPLQATIDQGAEPLEAVGPIVLALGPLLSVRSEQNPVQIRERQGRGNVRQAVLRGRPGRLGRLNHLLEVVIAKGGQVVTDALHCSLGRRVHGHPERDDGSRGEVGKVQLVDVRLAGLAQLHHLRLVQGDVLAHLQPKFCRPVDKLLVLGKRGPVTHAHAARLEGDFVDDARDAEGRDAAGLGRVGGLLKRRPRHQHHGLVRLQAVARDRDDAGVYLVYEDVPVAPLSQLKVQLVEGLLGRHNAGLEVHGRGGLAPRQELALLLHHVDVVGHHLVVAAAAARAAARHGHHRGAGQHVVRRALLKRRRVVVRHVHEEGVRHARRQRPDGRRQEAPHGVAAEPVDQAPEFPGVRGAHGLADERVDAQPVDKQVVHLFTRREQLRNDVQVRPNLAGSVEHVLGQRQRSAVAVVQPQAVEQPCRLAHILLHVVPEEGAVLGRAAVAQLHAVPPGDELPPQVHVRARLGKVA